MGTDLLLRDLVPTVTRRARASFPAVTAPRAAILIASVLLSPTALAQVDTTKLVFTNTSSVSEHRNEHGHTLPQLVEDALEKNLKLRIDEAQIEEARALYDLAAAQAYPRFSGTALFGGPTPEQKTMGGQDSLLITPASREGDLNFGELGVTFRLNADGALPLYSFGKISNAKEAASYFVRAAQQKVGIAEADVVLNVHRAFWAYQLTRSFVSALRDGEKTLEKVLHKIEELLDSDSPQVTENDRLRLLHALATVRVKMAEAENASQIATGALKLLTGREQTAELEVALADLDDLPAEIPNVDEYAQAARDERPELRALHSVMDAQRKYVDFRKSQFWPDFFLGATLRFAYTSNSTNQTNPFIFDDANFFEAGLGFGLRYELDVFNKLALLEQAEASANTRNAEARALAQAVEVEVRKFHNDLTSGYDRIKLLERATRAARGWLTASTLAYDIGTGDAGELIDAFLAWAASEGELQKTRYDMHLAHAELARSAGRLVSARERPHN